MMLLLSLPMHCKELENLGVMACWSIERILYLTVSIIVSAQQKSTGKRAIWTVVSFNTSSIPQVLIVFVLYALTVRTMIFEDAPLSRHPLSRSMGHIEFYDTSLRIAMVIGPVLFKGSLSVLAMLIILASCALFLFVNAMLPYYNFETIQVRSASYAFYCLISLTVLLNSK